MLLLGGTAAGLLALGLVLWPIRPGGAPDPSGPDERIFLVVWLAQSFAFVGLGRWIYRTVARGRDAADVETFDRFGGYYAAALVLAVVVPAGFFFWLGIARWATFEYLAR